MNIYVNKRAGRCDSFTFLEMMIVVGIITILLGMTYAASIRLRSAFKTNQATLEARHIAIAIKSYKQEYQKWPNQSQTATDITYFCDNYLVMRALTTNNPRSICFLSIQQNVLDRNGNYMDPWGTPYIMAMDENGDGIARINYIGPVTNTLLTEMPRNPDAVYTGVVDVTVDSVGVASFGTTNVISLYSWEE